MKKIIATVVLLILIILAAVPGRAFAANSDSRKAFVDYAQSQLGNRGSDYGMTMEWCVWFTTLCAYNNNLCSSADKVNDNVFPPYARSTWEENNWAATGVTYQANWMTAYDKGVLYRFTNDARLQSNKNIKKSDPESVIPESGDLIYFDWKGNDTWNHVAIVKEYLPETDEIVYIGGNQGEEENPEERVVSQLVRYRSDPEIAGIMHIDYSAVSDGIPMPVEDVNAMYRIKSDYGVKLRMGYGLDYEIIDVIPDRAECYVICKTERTVNGYTWAKTTYNGKTGWFAIKYAEEIQTSVGDADGDGIVNTRDAVCILRYAAGIDMEIPQSADVNYDGVINTADAALVLKYAAGLIDRF